MPKFFIITVLFALLISLDSEAYFAINESAEIIPEGQYRIGLGPQVILTKGGGTNYNVYFDTYLAESLNARFTLGTGQLDFWTSASAKWVPIPDYEKQPAMGLKGAVIYSRESTTSFYHIQVSPIISKVVQSESGKLNPYIGLPITVTYQNSQQTTATQFTIGSEWSNSPSYEFGGEFNLNLNKTESSLSVYVNFPFDEKEGFVR